MKKIFVIAGCNGAGKTTASFTILPDILACDEFINADEIARGLSPFHPEKVSIEAGKLMLSRIKKMLHSGKTFAFETTLATKSYSRMLHNAKKQGYQTTCLFFWLSNVEIAINRVRSRVNEGGHNIPEEVIRRRYHNGLQNFFSLYVDIWDSWLFIDNSGPVYEVIAEGGPNSEIIHHEKLWLEIRKTYDNK